MIVELGANDMLRGIDPGATRANLDGILDGDRRPRAAGALAGIPAPPNYAEDYREAFKAMFRDLAAEHDAIYYSSFLGGMAEGRSMREIIRLMQPDGLHPNAEGVAADRRPHRPGGARAGGAGTRDR